MKQDGNTFAGMSRTDPSRLVNTDKLKAEIQAALPISAVAERLADVELTPAGHQSKGLCPIHGEDTPSFYVNDGKNVFHCYGCKAGGDAITLVRQVYHVGYREALALLAKEAGIDIAAYERPPTPEEKERDRLRAWCEAYIDGLDYDCSRVARDTAAMFAAKVPQTPKGPLPSELKGKDYLFKGSALFPYRTATTGRLVGWKVRHPDKKMFAVPHDFPLWQPVVWGLYEARPHIVDGKLIVVEGEYDCMVMHDHGIQHTAAIGGSNWTDEQMQILEDLRIREVIFLLDGDEGGSTAAEAISKRFWRHPKIKVRIQQAWAGSDPEDMLRAMGPDLVLQHIESARGALEWLLYREWSSTPRQTLSDKLDYVRWVQTEYGDKLVGVQETLVLREVASWMGLSDAEVLDFANASKTLLQAPDSEKVVLGRCIRDSPYYLAIRKKIVRTDFFVLKHQRVWSVLEGMLGDGLEFDPVTVKRLAEGQGIEPEYIDVLLATGDLNIGWHEDQVVDFSVRRQARADADYFREVIADLNVPANRLIGTLTHQVTSKALGRGSGAFRGIQDQVDEAVEKIHERMRNPNTVHGIDLGSQFPVLSQTLQGFQPRRLVLVAATSGRGKSTLTLQWVTGLAVHQAIPTDFVSLEMDADEILFKQCSHLTGIDSMKISSGQLSDDEMKRVEQAMLRIRKSPLRIYAPDGITPNEFLLYARESVMERRTEVFVLDYVQHMGPDPETMRMSKYDQLGEAARLMKQKIARGLDTTVIACAQLRRDAANSDEPTPEDMGDSYDIVRAADVIVLINENDNQQAEIWVGKNRQGPGGKLIPAYFDKPLNTFRESQGARTPDYAVL